MANFLIKLLKGDIFKVRLWSILDYLQLLIILIVILVLGLSPSYLFSFFLKGIQWGWLFSFFAFAGMIFTGLAFSIVCTHQKIDSIISNTIKHIKFTHEYIKEKNFLIGCIKKSKFHPLTAFEENALQEFLTKINVSKEEL